MIDDSDAAQQARAIALFKMMADRIPGMVWSTDAELRLTSIWGAGLTALRRRSDQVVGKTLAEFFQTEDEDFPVIAAHRRALTGESVDYDFEWSGRSYRAHVERLADEAGAVVGCVGFAQDITEQKQAEEAWRESEKRYLHLMNSIPQPLWRGKANGEVVAFNRCWYEYTGQTPEEARGTGWMKALHPDDLARVRERIQAAVAEGTHVEIEYRLRRASDGSYRWHLSRSFPLTDENGKILARFGSVLDIDDRKQAEESLANSRAILHATVESLPLGFYALGADGRYLLDNAVTRANWGPVVGKTPEEVAPTKQLRVRWRANNRRALAGEKVEGEASLMVDGEKRFIYNVVSPIRQGEQIIGVLGVNVDITDRKRAAEALKKARDELEEMIKERTAELAIFRRLAEASSQGLGIADMKDRVVYFNPALCRMLAVAKPAHAVGKNLTAFYPKEYLSRRQKEVSPALLRDGHWEGEIIFRGADKKVHALQHSFLIRDEQGNPSHRASVLTDITERKRAEEALRQSHDELQAIYDGVIDGLLVADVETRRFVRANPTICRMLGYSEQELLRLSAMDIHPKENLPTVLQRFQGLVAHHLDLYENAPVLRKDGRIFHADINAKLIVYDGRPCAIGFFHDITERKQAQEALERERRKLQHMLRASDHERQLIAYDIHDGLAQEIAGALMQFEIFEHQQASKPKKAADAFEAGMAMLRRGHCEARRLVNGIRPPILDESGVLAAIAHLVREPIGTNAPKIEFRSRVSFERLASVEENSIYRIVQESVINACKHSKSKKVRVNLVQRDDRIRIEVRDWGIGFDPNGALGKQFGLTGIRERVRLLGGRCRIRSKPKEGTTVAVELPLMVRRTEE